MHLVSKTICVQKMTSGSFKNIIYKMCLDIMYLIYMYKKDLVWNNPQWFICHKTKRKQAIYSYLEAGLLESYFSPKYSR